MKLIINYSDARLKGDLFWWGKHTLWNMLLHDSNVRKDSWYFARKLFCSLQTTRRSWKASRIAILNCLRKWRKRIDSILSSRWIPCTFLNHLELLHGYVRNDLYRIDGFYVTVWGYSTIGRKSICWFYVNDSFFPLVFWPFNHTRT